MYYYNARFYDAYLNHFIQADTVMPEPGLLISYIRYAYVYFNPVRYVDPTGHRGHEGGGGTTITIIIPPTTTTSNTSEKDFNDAEDYKFLVDYVFESYPNVYDALYNTQGRVDGAILNYEKIRFELFMQFGMTYIDITGMIDDIVFMSITAAAEFGTTSGSVNNESLEALSNQYYSRREHPGPMQCYGSCSLSQQLLWSTQMEAWYRDEPLDEFVMSVDLTGPTSAGALASAGYKNGANFSWFWGNVDYPGKAKYIITAETYNEEYPEKPYFIVYSGQYY